MYLFKQELAPLRPYIVSLAIFLVFVGLMVTLKKLRRKTNLKLRSLNFFRKLFFSENCKRISNIRKTPFKCFLTMPKHGEVIEHKVDKLELALENNIELS